MDPGKVREDVDNSLLTVYKVISFKVLKGVRSFLSNLLKTQNLFL